MYDFDLFVIGAGSGGVRASRMAAATGARVAVAEARFLGGTCVNIGCVPKKLFYYGSHFQHEFGDAKGYGWAFDSQSLQFDWNTLRDNKTKEIKRLNGIYANMLANANVQVIDGWGKLVDAHTVQVGTKQYSAEKILIATGCGASVPPIDGAELCITSDDVFELPSLPEKIVIVGGGYIALEFAGIFNGLGVDTTVVYRGPNVLKRMDLALGEKLLDEMRKQGIHIYLNADVSKVDSNPQDGNPQDDNEKRVQLADGTSLLCGEVMYATGRPPLTDNLGLEAVGVARRDNGEIIVDEHFKTSVDNIYALGDIIGTAALTPVALAQGMAFVATTFKGQATTLDYGNIATAVFSQPNIGTVGLTEEEARARYPKIAIYESDFRHLKLSLTDNTERTFMKIIVDETSDKVLGIHMLGADAGEIIQGLAVAMKVGVTKAQLDSTIGIHPTAAEEFVTMRERSR